MAALIQVPLSDPQETISTRRKFKVELKSAWADAWGGDQFEDVQNYLVPSSASLAAAPTVSKAVLRYAYGSIKREDKTAYQVYGRPELLDKFVRIQMLPEQSSDDAGTPQTPTLLWGGVIVQESAAPIGTDGDEDGVAAGDLALRALGYEALLEQVSVRSAWVKTAGGVVEIDSCPAFNERYVRGEWEMGNRSDDKQTVGGKSCYVFSGEGAVWSAKDIIEYLLAVYQPRGVTFELSGQTEALAALKPAKLEAEGKPVWHLICELADRKRGVGLAVDWSQTGSKVILSAHSLFDADVIVSGTTIPGNNKRLSFILDGRKDIEDIQLESDSMTRYGRVIIQGERLRSCFSVSYADATLEAGWTSTEETNYKGVAGATAELKDRERATDKYRHVFAALRIPDDFDWLAGDGVGGALENVNPELHDDLVINLDDSPNIRDWGHVLLDHLPFRKPEDLTDKLIDYMPPLAVAYDEANSKWVQVDRHNSPTLPTGNVRMLDNDFGVELGFSPNHRLALNHWTPASDITQLANVPSNANSFDWQKVIATVCVETDKRVAAVVELDSGRPDLELVVRIPNAHLWVVAANTVIGVTDGALVRWGDLHSGEGDETVRDDTQQLLDAAELARNWYGKARSAVSFTIQDLLLSLPVGTYLEAVSDAASTQNAASVVTQVVFDFERYATHIQTSFGELEFGS